MFHLVFFRFAQLLLVVAGLTFVVLAVVGRRAIACGRHGDFRKLAAAGTVLVVVVLARAHVAQYGLLVFHFVPPDFFKVIFIMSYRAQIHTVDITPTFVVQYN